MNRSHLYTLVAAVVLAACSDGNPSGGAAGSGGAYAGTGLPEVPLKDSYHVGFVQAAIEQGNPWRTEETRSMKAEAEARGYTLEYFEQSASGGAQDQVAKMRAAISLKLDAIFLAPLDETVLAPVVVEARRARVPVFLLDRDVNHAIAHPGEDYVAFLGSDFELEGRMVGEWIVAKLENKEDVEIIEIEGTVGASPAIKRKKGFDEVVLAAGMKIAASASGDFAMDKGKQVAARLLAAHPGATVIYCHNDAMAMGAIAAIEEAGKRPNQDIVVVSIDGARFALEAIRDDKLGASVTCSPSFGPLAFDTLEKAARGEDIPSWVVVEDILYDATNITDEAIAQAF
jgi:galactofuranose transport system substrate-binding protein